MDCSLDQEPRCQQQLCQPNVQRHIGNFHIQTFKNMCNTLKGEVNSHDILKEVDIMLTKSYYMPLDSGLDSIYPDFSLKNPLYATSKLQESHITPDAGTFDHTT